MAYLIGYMFGFWILYALLACFVKHKISIVITLIMGIVVGIVNISMKQDFFSLLAVIITSLLILFIPKIQIKSQNKKILKDNENNNENMTENISKLDNNIIVSKQLQIEKDFYSSNKNDWIPIFEENFLDLVEDILKINYYDTKNFKDEDVESILNEVFANINYVPDDFKKDVLEKISWVKHKNHVFYNYEKEDIIKCLKDVFLFIIDENDLICKDSLSHRIMSWAYYGEKDYQLQLSELYEYGVGVKKDRRKQKYWLMQACENNSDEAKYLLGKFYSFCNDDEAQKLSCFYYLQGLDSEDIRSSFNLNTLPYMKYNPDDFEYYEIRDIDICDLDNFNSKIDSSDKNQMEYYKKYVRNLPTVDFTKTPKGFMENTRVYMPQRKPNIQPYTFKNIEDYCSFVKEHFSIKEVILKNNKGFGYTLDNPIPYQFVFKMDVLGYYLNFIAPNYAGAWELIDYRRIGSFENNVDKYVVTYLNRKTHKAKIYVLYFWMYGINKCFPHFSKIYRLPKDFKPQDNIKLAKFDGLPRDLLDKKANLYGSKIYYKYITNDIEEYIKKNDEIEPKNKQEKDNIVEEKEPDNIDDIIARLFEKLENSKSIKEQKIVFHNIMDLMKEDGGLIELRIDEIYKYNDIIDLKLAKDILAPNIYEKVLLLHTKLLNGEIADDNQNKFSYNYEGYLLRCRDIALSFVMLTGTSLFVNSKLLKDAHKNSVDSESKYLQGAWNLINDNMVYSIEWQMLLRRYKRYVYNIIDDGEINLDEIEFFDYEEILGNLIINQDEDDVSLDKIEDHFKRYNLPIKYKSPIKK